MSWMIPDDMKYLIPLSHPLSNGLHLAKGDACVQISAQHQVNLDEKGSKGSAQFIDLERID